MIFTKSLSFETGPASPRTTAIGMAFAASVILIAMVIVARITYELDTAGERTQGEVIQYIERGDDMQSAVFRFTDAQGQVYTITDSAKSAHMRYRIGEKVPIVYNLDNPSGARKDGAFSLYLWPIVLGFMSLLFYGGAAFVWRFRSLLQNDYEARRGRAIVTTVGNDGSVTQTTHSSVPVFRWTGFFLAGLGIAAWLGALAFTFQGFVADGRPLKISISIYLLVIGGLLLLGATASLRHAKFLQELE